MKRPKISLEKQQNGITEVQRPNGISIEHNPTQNSMTIPLAREHDSNWFIGDSIPIPAKDLLTDSLDGLWLS